MTAIQVRHGDIPAAFKVYRDEYERAGLRLGTITIAEVEPELMIVNAVMQDDWRRPDPTTILVGGKWEDVAPRIERALGDGIEKFLWRLTEPQA